MDRIPYIDPDAANDDIPDEAFADVPSGPELKDEEIMALFDAPRVAAGSAQLLAAAKLAVAHGHRWAWFLRDRFTQESGFSAIEDDASEFEPCEEAYDILGSHTDGRWANAAFALSRLPSGNWTDEAIRDAVLAEDPDMHPCGELGPRRDVDGRIVHVTNTDRTRWTVHPCNSSHGSTFISIEVRRPIVGNVLTAEVYLREGSSPDAYVHVEGRYCRRHVGALLRCLIPFVGEEEALSLCAERSLVECATSEEKDQRLGIIEGLEALHERYQWDFYRHVSEWLAEHNPEESAA